jgi:enoyl-CoA hydratase
VRVSKQIVAGAVGWTDAEAYRAQAELAAPVFGSADAQEGARAFAEKREPVWRGE